MKPKKYAIALPFDWYYFFRGQVPPFITISIAVVNRTNREDIFNRRTAFAFIFIFSVIRGAIAFSMELGTDEAYYWFYSQDLKWNYFDHPPLVAIWIRVFTANLALQDIEGFVRLGSVVGGAIASWVIYQACTTIHSAKAGLFGVCLYHASFYASVTAGIFIMPDTPQMVFYTISLWMIARITKDTGNWFNWLAFGAAAGLCIMSKVYGAFLWTGLGLFALMKKREWFSQPYIYGAFLVTAAMASPILVWNFQNDFLTYKFHSSRADVTSGGFSLILFCREVVNQVLYNNPFNVIVIVTALTAFLKKRKAENDALSIFNFIALPLAVLLLGIAFFRDTTLPHWSGPAYVALIPLAAVHLTGTRNQYAKRIIIAALSALGLFLVVWQYLIHYAPEPIGVRDVDKKSFQAARDFVKRLYSGFENFQLIAETKNSWERADEAFLQLYEQESKSGRMEKNAPVICYKWWGAHIEYYFCHPNNIPMIGLGEPNELHEYLFMNAERKDSANLNTAYCIVPADDNYNVQVKYSPYYHKIEKPSLITVKRERKPDVKFYVYKLRGWKNRLPMVEPEKTGATALSGAMVR